MPSILYLNTDRVLDESALGKRGTAQLTERFSEAREKYEQLRQQATATSGTVQAALHDEMTTFETEVLQGLEDERAALREAVLEKTEAIVRAVREERGAELVLDATAVIMASPDADITDEVIRRLDAEAG